MSDNIARMYYALPAEIRTRADMPEYARRLCDECLPDPDDVFRPRSDFAQAWFSLQRRFNRAQRSWEQGHWLACKHETDRADELTDKVRASVLLLAEAVDSIIKKVLSLHGQPAPSPVSACQV